MTNQVQKSVNDIEGNFFFQFAPMLLHILFCYLWADKDLSQKMRVIVGECDAVGGRRVIEILVVEVGNPFFSYKMNSHFFFIHMAQKKVDDFLSGGKRNGY